MKSKSALHSNEIEFLTRIFHDLQPIEAVLNLVHDVEVIDPETQESVVDAIKRMEALRALGMERIEKLSLAPQGKAHS